MTAPVQTMACELVIPNTQHLYGQIESNARYAKRLARQDSHAGKRVVICGAGPSLAVEKDRLPVAHEVWACNSALPYLWDAGVRVTHGVTVDQNEAMADPAEFGRALPVKYLVASSIHPRLRDRLLKAKRDLTWFHSFLGQPDPAGYVRTKDNESYEWMLYTTRFRPTAQVGYGLNTVPRAVCLALFMGFAEIHVVGADCACAPEGPPMPKLTDPGYADWLATRTFYADGRSALVYGADAWMTEGEIDGRRWHTRADMVISAGMLVDLARQTEGRVRLVGDTLPNAIMAHADDPEWMARLPKLTGVGKVENFRLKTGEETV